MSIFDIPTRHEFFVADDPQYPIALGTQAVEVVRTIVSRRYVGLETEEIVFQHYVQFQ